MPPAPTPKALFLTWRTYGTWLPGDERGWISRHRNGFGEPVHASDIRLEEAAKGQMRRSAVLLSGHDRLRADEVIRECCAFHGWTVVALNVRTNHVHIVVTSEEQPKLVLTALKARVTRVFRANDWTGADGSLWAKGGSARVLWDDEGLAAAVHYVKYGQ